MIRNVTISVCPRSPSALKHSLLFFELATETFVSPSHSLNVSESPLYWENPVILGDFIFIFFPIHNSAVAGGQKLFDLLACQNSFTDLVDELKSDQAETKVVSASSTDKLTLGR